MKKEKPGNSPTLFPNPFRINKAGTIGNIARASNIPARVPCLNIAKIGIIRNLPVENNSGINRNPTDAPIFQVFIISLNFEISRRYYKKDIGAYLGGLLASCTSFLSFSLLSCHAIFLFHVFRGKLYLKQEEKLLLGFNIKKVKMYKRALQIDY
jgi:hypothetical protein